VRIAIVSESSSADKNSAIASALDGRGHTIINIGMHGPEALPALNYVHAGIIAGVVLGFGMAELVVGGCGTGQGFAQAAMQFPHVNCGQVACPLDAWLFSQVNGGNCISLRLNQGYGWAGDVNLRMIFDAFFSVERGAGYPAHRREAQKAGREMLARLSGAAHHPIAEILADLPEELLRPVLETPGMASLVDACTIKDGAAREILRGRAPRVRQ